MPIFEYECNQCGQRTEHLQLSSSAPLTACPECNGEVRKLMSAPAFQFKGSGWYVTDYANKDKGKSKDSEGASSSGGDGTKGKAADGGDSGGSTKSESSTPSSGSADKAPSKGSSAKTASPSD